VTTLGESAKRQAARLLGSLRGNWRAVRRIVPLADRHFQKAREQAVEACELAQETVRAVQADRQRRAIEHAHTLKLLSRVSTDLSRSPR